MFTGLALTKHKGISDIMNMKSLTTKKSLKSPPTSTMKKMGATTKKAVKAEKGEKTEKTVNTFWFEQSVRRVAKSFRAFAKMVDMNNATVSLIINGQRKISLEDAIKWAEVLNVELKDVLENAGLSSSALFQSNVINPPKPSAIPLKGYVDSELRIVWGPIAGSATVPNPYGILSPGSIACVRCQTASGAFEGIDGALIYYREVEDGSIDYEAMGRLCIVKVAGNHYLRILKRGYETGRHNLALFNGQLKEEGVIVQAATPVVWMKL